MAQYLYAAAVQGIQDFIFDTNKLQEIAGASEIVEQICTTKFAEILGKKNAEELAKDPNLLVGAAGNIKYLFEDKNENQCKDVVLRFPFEVAKMAPGITISQTVVKIEGEITNVHIKTAEEQLQIQRNLPTCPSNISLMIARRTAKTGKAAVKKDGEYLDEASVEKLKKYKSAENNLFKKVVPENYQDLIALEKRPEEIVSDDNSWIAVVHADGNDLGKLIPTFFEGGIKGQELITRQRNFSQLLDKSTTNAAKKAFSYVLEQVDKDGKLKKEDAIVPFRPIVCGGDDLTIIVQAKFALEFTRIFLEEFTKETKENFKDLGVFSLENGLTACAGIAYVKQKYPFHYAVDLAGELCDHAKKVAKAIGKEKANAANNEFVLTPACLSFYKIESAFVRKYSEIEKNELSSSIAEQLSNCPYMLNEREDYVDTISKTEKERIKNSRLYYTISDLKNWTKFAKENPAIASRLRQVLGMLNTPNKSAIHLELSRIESLNKDIFSKFDIDAKKEKQLDPEKEESKRMSGLLHLHDFLSINSINE